MKQQFYGHFLATRIFHLAATEKKFQSPLGAHIKKLISDPVAWYIIVIFHTLVLQHGSLCVFFRTINY